MRRRFLAISGFVLAGGQSRRMGSPKDRLELGGETLLDRQVRRLSAVARRVAVVGGSENRSRTGVETILDDQPGLGPLGGIATALARTRTEYNLFVGCDAPFILVQLLRYLCEAALESQADATVPDSFREGLQPTCAVYRRRALGAIRASLRRGDFSVRGFFPRVRCLVIPWPEIARRGFPPWVFDNMNTPQDYQAAKVLAGIRTNGF